MPQLVQFARDFLHERLHEESLNIKGKSLVAMQLWCNREKFPLFRDTLAQSSEVVALLQELLHFECAPDAVHGAQPMQMIRSTAGTTLDLLGIKRAADGETGRMGFRALGSLKKGLTDARTGVVGGITTATNVGKGAVSGVTHGVTTVGKGAVSGVTGVVGSCALPSRCRSCCCRSICFR